LVGKEDNLRTATLPFALLAAERTTVNGLLSKLNLTKCEAAVIMPLVSERPIGLMDGRVADRIKRSNLMTTGKRETSTAPILHLSFKVGEEAKLVSRCSKGRAPPSTQLASTLTENAQSFRFGTSHDCSGDNDGTYDDCNVEWSGDEAHHGGNFQRRDNALDSNLRDGLHISKIISLYTSTSTTISYLLCAAGLFFCLIVRVGGCALLKVGSKIELTGRSGAKSAGIMIINASKKRSSLVKYSRAKARITTFRKYSIMLSLIFWACLVVVGGRSLAEVNVVDMDGLFNTVSNAVYIGCNTGNSIMANGDTAILAFGPYKCSEGTCADSYEMLIAEHLYGEVKCVEDNASCVLDGENARRLMTVSGTGSRTLILRALTFDKGHYGYSGGGIFIGSDSIMDLELLVFSNNRATSSSYGGGAIYVSSSGTNVNVYSTSFYGNTAVSGNGDDIYRDSYAADSYAADDDDSDEPIITIHNICPSPYSSNTPIQGKKRIRIV
jgi:predicted outer membrane repeat protein